MLVLCSTNVGDKNKFSPPFMFVREIYMDLIVLTIRCLLFVYCWILKPIEALVEIINFYHVFETTLFMYVLNLCLGYVAYFYHNILIYKNIHNKDSTKYDNLYSRHLSVSEKYHITQEIDELCPT
jgi:hypothetical protein